MSWIKLSIGAVLLLLAFAGTAVAQAAAEAPARREPDRCSVCHSDPRFLVQNKKLYDYYQNWAISIHRQEGLTCADCHGGDSTSDDKDVAHGKQAMASSNASSPINYRNIPATCAKCHEEVYEQFRRSEHFKHLRATAQDEQGPNCVTCHGSLNVTVLTVATVRQTCSQCHNEKTENHPEIPAQAETVLNNFLSIQRFYRFIATRSPPGEASSFFRLVDPAIAKLNAEWHTFNIDKIEEKTRDLVQVMKVRRNELLRASKEGRR